MLNGQPKQIGPVKIQYSVDHGGYRVTHRDYQGVLFVSPYEDTKLRDVVVKAMTSWAAPLELFRETEKGLEAIY